MRNRKALAHLLLLGVVVIWGATFVLVKAALSDASPLLFNFVRMILATLALALINRRALRGITREQWRGGALAGLMLALGYQFQTLGLARTTAAKSAFITGLVVVFVPMFTLIPRLRPSGTPRPGLATAAGTIAAFAGVLILTTPAGTRLSSLFSSIGSGDLLTVGCAVAFALHLLSLAHFPLRMSAGLLATLQIGAASTVMLVMLPLEHPHFHMTPRLGVTLAITSLLATAAAFTIQSFAQQVLPPTHTVLLLTLEPVFALATSLLILHVGLGRRALLGAALILAAIAIIELTPSAHATELPA
jgi:drug/metabolite transporter (DMT)-like permease